jgi:hypothetical protein
LGYIENVITITDVESSASDAEISIYPNPVKDRLNIDLNYIPNSISIYTVDGSVVEQYNNDNVETNVSFDVSGLISGAYFVVIDSKTKRVVKKFIKN